MNISVFGLGYVGCVSAGCLTHSGHRVIGVDILEDKVARIRAGQATVVEPGIDELLQEAHQQGRITATTSAAEAIANSELSLVCVGTPSRRGGDLDLSALQKTLAAIGQALRDKEDSHVVVIRSTVPPGTIEELVWPTLKEASGRTTDTLAVILVPEFLREGSAVSDYFNPPLVVVGVQDPETAQEDALIEAAVDELLGAYRDQLQYLVYREAELLKSMCNVFHALKVCFGNEVGALCSALSLNGRRLMQAFIEDRTLNISGAYLRPGLPFGGSCLPKDLRATVHLARSLSLEVPLLESIAQSNQMHLYRALDAIPYQNAPRVGMDGIAFKAGTDDLRESPKVAIAEYLIGKGCDLRIYDPAIETTRLTGANLAYIERHVPHLACRLVSSPEALIEHCDILVLTREDGKLLELAAEAQIQTIDISGAQRSCVPAGEALV